MVLRWLNSEVLTWKVAWFFRAILCTATLASASYGQVGASLGYFSLTSKTTAGSTNLANLGHFKMNYDIPISYQFVIKPSYSLYLLGFDTTDIGYGFNLEFEYFPFSFNRSLSLGQKDLQMVSAEKIRPFVGVSFHQRQFQSIQSTYAGMGVSFGTHYQFSEEYRFVLGLSLMNLGGPLDSSISEQHLFIGISLE